MQTAWKKTCGGGDRQSRRVILQPPRRRDHSRHGGHGIVNGTSGKVIDPATESAGPGPKPPTRASCHKALSVVLRPTKPRCL